MPSYISNSTVVKKFVLPLLYVIILGVGSIYAFKKPEYNWDMLAYMGLVVYIDHPEPVLIHDVVYHTAAKEVPERWYKYLADTTNRYRKQMMNDPGAFYNTIPFYVVKPLYIGTCYVLYKAGIGLVKATVLPSVIAFFIIGILFYYWARKYLHPHTAFAGSLCMMLSPPLIEAAKLSTPDCMAAMLTFAAIYFFVEKQKLLLGFVLFILSIFTRIDNIIPAFFFVSAIAFTLKFEKGRSINQYVFALVIMICTYFAITYNVHRFGWDLTYYKSFFINKQAVYAHDNVGISLKVYFLHVHSALMQGMLFSHIPIFLMMGVLVLSNDNRSTPYFSIDRSACIAAMCTIMLKILLNPEMADRLFINYYLVFAILLIRKFGLLQHPSRVQNRNNLSA